MTEPTDRHTTTWIAAGVAASWPSVLAAVLLRLTILAGTGSVHVLLVGMALSAAAGAVVGWLGWRSAQRAKALWTLYGLLAAVPMCGIWAGLGKAALPLSTAGDILRTSVFTTLLALPVLIFVGPIVGGDVALTLACVEGARRRYGARLARIVGSIVMAAHFGAALGLALAGNIWRKGL